MTPELEELVAELENTADQLRAGDLSPEDAAAAVDDRLARAGVTPTDRLVVIHVSAGNPFRRWPLDHFVSLTARLAAGDPHRRIIMAGRDPAIHIFSPAALSRGCPR